MKKLVILLIAIALGVMILWSPLSARDYDPTKPLPWIANSKNPSGDDDPFGVDKSVQRIRHDWWLSFLWTIIPIMNNTQSLNEIIDDDATNSPLRNTEADRTAEIPRSHIGH
jgi:hypothetical protein